MRASLGAWLTDLMRFDDLALQRRAAARFVVLAAFVIVPLYGLTSWFFARQPSWTYVALALIVLLAGGGGWLMQRGKERVGMLVLFTGVWALIAAMVLGTGAHSTHVSGFAPVLVMTGLLTSAWTTLVFGAAGVLVVLAAAELNQQGFYGPSAPLFPDVVSPIAQLVTVTLLVAALMYSFKRLVLHLAETRSAFEVTQTRLRQAEKMDAVGQLAGGVAHDFNNILTGMLGHIDLLRMEAEEADLSPEFHKDLSELERSAERAANITRQLLHFSRKESLEQGVTSVAKVVGDATTMLRVLVREDVEFQVVCEAPGRVALGATAIEQVLMNLVINASDAMPRGGGLVITVVELPVPSELAVTTGVLAPGDYVVLGVSDSGAGVATENHERVFEPFFTTKPVGKGTGLGLSTVLGIVQRAGGQIRVRSEVGSGTTFQVFLPRSSDAPAELPLRTVPPPSSGPGGVVLLVEDDPAILRVSARALDAAGFEVVACEHPELALERARSLKKPLTLLVTDVIMPGMNGRDLAQRLEAERGPVPVLFMSGYTAGLLEDLGLGLDDPRLLVKPFTPAVLVERVKATLREQG